MEEETNNLLKAIEEFRIKAEEIAKDKEKEESDYRNEMRHMSKKLFDIQIELIDL